MSEQAKRDVILFHIKKNLPGYDYEFLRRTFEELDALRAQLSEAQKRLAEIEREQPRCEAALRTLTGMGYYWGGGAYFKPPQSDAAPAPAAQVAQGVADDVVRDAIKRACQYYKQAGRVAHMAPMLAKQHEETADRLIAKTLAAAQQQSGGAE